MSSFGHVRDMMERYAANRELLQAKRKRHFRKSNLYDNAHYGENSNQLKELDKAEWERIKIRIRANKRREKGLWIISSVFVVFSLLLLIHWLF
jgi:hypothetical protein